MMKKTGVRLAAGAALMALSTGLAACSSSGSSSSPGSSSGAGSAAGHVTLSYGIWDPSQAPGMRDIIKAFEAQNPGISVELQLTPGTAFFTKLQAGVTSGTAPDVFWIDPILMRPYETGGAIAPLTSMHLDTSVYLATNVNFCTYSGTLYGVPKDFDTVALWYNKALFDQAHVAYPTASWTWSDFTAAAAKLSNPAKGVFGTAPMLDGQEDYYDTVYQNGGYIIAPDGKSSGWDQAKTIGGLQFWANLMAKHSSPSVSQINDTSALNMFETGKLGMLWLGSWNVPALASSAVKSEINVVQLPTGTQRATITDGLCNVVYAKTPHLAQAEKFAAFLGSKQANLIQGRTGTVIPAYKGTESSWLAAYPQYNVQAYLDELSYAVPYPSTANTYDWLLKAQPLVAEGLSGAMPMNTAASQLAALTNASIAKSG